MSSYLIEACTTLTQKSYGYRSKLQTKINNNAWIFFFLFQLKLTPQFSKRICVVCNFQLTSFCNAKANIIKAQKSLMKFMSTSNSKPKYFRRSENPSVQTISQVTNNTNLYLENAKEEVHEEEIIEEHLIDDDSFHEVSLKFVENQPKITENFIKCEQCDEKFQNSTNFQEHSLTCQKLKQKFRKSTKWNCYECKKSFSGGSSLTNHISIYHSTSSLELPCPVAGCEKKCKTKKQLTQHLKTHNDDKQICPECGLVVGNKHNLTKHIKRLHLKIYNFYCDLCDYKGFFKFNIDQHVSILTLNFNCLRKSLIKFIIFK